MSTMTVKILLDLINKVTPKAKTAQSDLKGIKTAAQDLNKVRAGAGIAQDIDKAGAAAKRTTQNVQNLKVALGQASQSAKSLGSSPIMALAPTHKKTDRKTNPKPTQTPPQSGASELPLILPMLGMGSVARLAAGAGAVILVKEAIKAHGQLQDAQKELAITTNQTDGVVKKSTENYRHLASIYGVTATEMTKSARDFANSGLDFNQSIAAAPVATKVAVAAFAELTDTTAAAIAVMNNMEITAQKLPDAFDAMALSGKLGQVELKNLAKILPEVTASGSKLGLKGLSGIIDISSALQIIRRGVASGDEAANRLENLFQKITADETVKNFKDQGVDIETKIKQGLKKGKDALHVTLEETKKLTKGDPFRINELFGDMQARAAIELLLKYEKEYNEFRARIAQSAAGTVEIDFKRALDRQNADLNKLRASWNTFAGRVGEELESLARGPARSLADALDGIGNSLKKGNDHRQKMMDAESVGKKLGTGEALTQEERSRLENDSNFRFYTEDKAKGLKTSREAENNLYANLQHQKSILEQKTTSTLLNFGNEQELANINRQIAAIENKRGSNNRTADRQSDAALGDHTIEGLRSVLTSLDDKIASLKGLQALTSNPTDKTAFKQSEIDTLKQRFGIENKIARKIAPDFIPAEKFGFGPGGSPQSSQHTGPGRGILSFKAMLGGNSAQAIRDVFDIDLGPAGITLMERLSSGLSSSTAPQSAAAGVGDAVKNTLLNVDFYSVGAKQGTDYAAGLASAVPQVRAATQALNIEANRISAGGKSAADVRNRLNGSLSDGVK
jgi:TP901 family phage tail tape measure protein